MTAPTLFTPKFKRLFAAGWLLWSALHMRVLLGFGIAWQTALTDSAVSNLFLLGTCILVMSIFRYYLPQKQPYGFIITLCAVATIVWFFSSRPVLLLIVNEHKGYPTFFAQSVTVRIVVAFLIIGCMSLVSVLWHTLQDQREMEKRKAEAERLSKEAELYNLRQQLQPHFLFNSLNSINALISAQPQKARTMVQQLSDFLRGTLKKENEDWVTLEVELNHLALYLEIEKVRFGHRLSTAVMNAADGKSMRLPALLLQPVVENAIKFGLYDTTGAVTITIEAEAAENQLIIRVTNPFDPATHAPQKGTGFGLRSVQRRLYLLFARNDLLQTKTKDHHFVTTIKIPQQHESNNR